MLDGLQSFLLQRGLPPHGYCLLWDPRLIWTHALSDAVIAAAYFSIPVFLVLFLRRRPDVEFGWVLTLFATFILACGTTHLLSIAVLWIPAYGIEGAVKAFTALASIVTAVALWPLLPKLLAIPAPSQLQRALADLRHEVAERERAEEMLRQSQKLQAVGELTAGIAHDFNNLLTAIGGNLARAQRLARSDSGVDRPLANALAATDRAAVLTSQLLAFSRKQPLRAEPVEIDAVLRDVLPLVERLIGENIVVHADLAEGLPTVEIDRNQFETALLNLAVNARDAIDGKGAGELLISSSMAGGEVIVALRDNGAGMDEETVRRATEPFFTTKPVGSGTGLGLSQAYGFVTQAGGRLEIESKPGAGTTVRLILPT